MKFVKITDSKVKELVFASIFGVLILGIPLNWYTQNIFIKKNFSIYAWDLVTFYEAQGYFVATNILGLVSLILSSFYDKYQIMNRNFEMGTTRSNQKRNQTIFFRVVSSIRFVLVIFTINYWIQLINLQWFSKLNYVFGIGFPYALYPFLLIINFLVIFILLIFEPWLFITKLLSTWFGIKLKNLSIFELISNFINRTLVYFGTLLLINWFSAPTFLIDFKSSLLSTFVFFTYLFTILYFKRRVK